MSGSFHRDKNKLKTTQGGYLQRSVVAPLGSQRLEACITDPQFVRGACVALRIDQPELLPAALRTEYVPAAATTH